ncbi:hypothetical protein BUALT_Bualt10G0063600 [Buddleja alternifolia]|uniref:WRKY domain-containing protein n=1 Tax=Buddleja alternifolia TaxID=168488 RepID=A0AAV6WVQ2_9LAMI|nr:hypothetical protein BUALT_Bualt10G0063600 [Buddleja alternifolia]
MKSGSTWEYKTLIDELSQGMEKANQLRVHLCSTSPSEAHDLLLQRIISSYENALLIVNWSGSVGHVPVGAPTLAAPESSISVDGSPRSDDMNKSLRDNHDGRATSKKRKMHPTWTEQVRVNSGNGLEGPTDDRFSWRKYGQKDILGAKYPRSYYRCTYRHVRNCWATKQVQRSDDDPTLFEITYKGTHVCNHSTNAVPPPPSPEKQEPKHNIPHCHQQEQQNQTLLNFKANLRVNTNALDIKETPPHFSFQSTFACHDEENNYVPVSSLPDENLVGTFSSLFHSPATSGSNYFSTATYQMNNYGGAPLKHSETDIADIISAHASTTNSPIGGMEFSIDRMGLDPNFPFYAPGFLHN